MKTYFPKVLFALFIFAAAGCASQQSEADRLLWYGTTNAAPANAR
jgi:hypothetical protein